ncbi:MAG: hypothetical protein OEY03_09050 [Rhizobacter sp.]|nr:hypothetical protein [Rhizobacter sp.]
MNTLALLSACAAIVLVRGMWLRAEMARFEPVRSRRLGPLRIELRRRIVVLGHDNGRGGLAFAQAHEQRLRVHRLLGVPVWRELRGIELPPHAMAMLNGLLARDFDAEFAESFRESEFARLDHSLISQLRMGWSRH